MNVDIPAQVSATEDTKNRTATGQSERPTKAYGKTQVEYWRRRLKRRSYLDSNGNRVEIPEWQVRISSGGRDIWWQTYSANQAVAATRARDIYVSLHTIGLEATLVRFKGPVRSADGVSVGEFIKEVEKYAGVRQKTFCRYVAMLRKIVADVAGITADASRYDPVNGGNSEWRAKIDRQKLSILTPQAVAEWRSGYVSRHSSDAQKQRSAEVSAAAYLRNARALFSGHILAVLPIKVPANPFAGIKIRDPGPKRYRSAVSAEYIWGSAISELRDRAPQQFLALFLLLWGGLRRSEADLLLWEQIDFKSRLISIRLTYCFVPKTDESKRDIDLSTPAAALLKKYRRPGAEFVLDGREPNPDSKHYDYRADATWLPLLRWLREKGVTEEKALHAMRKESGSYVAEHYGIEAARGHLGHRNIRITSSTYVTKRARVEVELPTKL